MKKISLKTTIKQSIDAMGRRMMVMVSHPMNSATLALILA